MNGVVLKQGAWEAKILSDFGMNLISLKQNGKEIMRTPTDEETLEKSPRMYGLPIIIPANRTADGTFSFRGKSYTMPINEPARNNSVHGLMSNAPFEILTRTETSLTARYQNRGERYPFAFDMTVEDTLTEKGFTRRLTIKALEAMPYTFGFHSTFREPKEYFVPLKSHQIRNERLLPTGEVEPPAPLVGCFDEVFFSSGDTVILDEVAFTVSENFDQWVLFNGDSKSGFLCVEPQCGMVNGLNIPGGHRVLEEGETVEFTVSFRLK